MLSEQNSFVGRGLTVLLRVYNEPETLHGTGMFHTAG